MASKASSSPVFRSSPAQSSPGHAKVTPTSQRIFRSPRSGGSYGCQREIFHPLSPRAEPSALLYYVSSDDDEEDNDFGMSPKSHKARFAQNGNSTSPSQTTLSPLNPKSQLKRSPRGNFDALPPSTPSGITITKNKLSQKTIEKSHASSTESTMDDGMETVSTREFLKEVLGSSDTSEYNRGTAQSSGSFSTITAPIKPRESELLEGIQADHGLAVSHNNTDSTQRIPFGQSLSPARFPLPDPLDDEDLSSNLSSLSSTPSCNSPISKVPVNGEFVYSPSIGRGPAKSSAIIHAQEVAAKLETLDLKAQEYGRVTSMTPLDKKFKRAIAAIYTKENRFDPKEAADLERAYQEKIQRVIEKRRQEELKWEEIKKQEQEQLQREAEEAARKVAEEQARREQEESRRREEENEKRRREEEAAKARVEKQKAEEQTRRQAEHRAREEREEKQKAEDQAKQTATEASNKAEAAAARAESLRKQQVEPEALRVSARLPPGPGRKRPETQSENLPRILKNLKLLRQTPDREFIKQSGLFKARRDIIPRFGQVTGIKEQTIQLRDYLKETLARFQNMEGPVLQAREFMFDAPDAIAEVPLGFLWLANEIAKVYVRQTGYELTHAPHLADPMGVIIVSIFADPRFLVNGHSFIDIVVARLMKHNPILRGELGPEATEEDFVRLQWKPDIKKVGRREGLEEHCNRIGGLAAGYAAIAGRDYRRSKLTNPYPMYNLWHIMAYILNQPMDKLTESHLFSLRYMITIAAKKLVSVYGHQAKKLLDFAGTTWANRAKEAGLLGYQAVNAAVMIVKRSDWWAQG